MPHYDYDKDYPFAAFITNLGKYNEGALVGEWVKFPTTAEELKKVFERIGIGAKDDFGQTYEEWFITDYDSPMYALPVLNLEIMASRQFGPIQIVVYDMANCFIPSNLP